MYVKKFQKWGLKLGGATGILVSPLGLGFKKISKMTFVQAYGISLQCKCLKNILLNLLNGWKVACFKFFIFFKI